MIKGISVLLYEKTASGTDEFNRTVYTESPEFVDNVVVAPVTSEAVINELSITGKHLAYYLMIPKGDYHVWEDCRVNFYGQDWHVFGYPEEWIDANTPGAWNKRYKVERYG